MSEKTPTAPRESEGSKKIEEIIEHQQFDARDVRDAAVEELGYFEEAWVRMGGGEIDRIKTQLAEAGDLRGNHEKHLELTEALEDAEDAFYANAKIDGESKSREEVLQSFADEHARLTSAADEAHDKWAAIGGDAIDVASAKLAALDMYTQPGEYNDAILELEDAEAEATRRLNAPEATPLKADTEAAPEGERLTDYLESIRTAQRGGDELTLKVLLKQYKEILETKSDDKEWVERHYKIAETAPKAMKLEAEPQRDKYQAQFAEASAEATRNIDTNEDDLRRAVAEEAARNVDARAAAAAAEPTPDTAPATTGDTSPAPARAESTTSTNERDTPKRKKRERKLGKWVASILTPSGWRGRMKARRDFDQAVKARGTEIYNERYAKFENGDRNEPSGWLANLDARDELRKEKRDAKGGLWGTFKKNKAEATKEAAAKKAEQQPESRPKLTVIQGGEQVQSTPIGTPENPVASPYDEATRELPKPSMATESDSDRRAA